MSEDISNLVLSNLEVKLKNSVSDFNLSVFYEFTLDMVIFTKYIAFQLATLKKKKMVAKLWGPLKL